MRLGLFFCAVLLAGFYAQAQIAPEVESVSPTRGETPANCIENREAYFSLDFWTFDQDPNKGHRGVASKPGCELAAADLIRDYHERLREVGEPVTFEYNEQEVTISSNGEVSLLYWHEGQARAFEGQTSQAIKLFQLSLKPEEENHGAWNEYALASIAFLKNDLAELKSQRSVMARAELQNTINLGVVDGLIACFGATYREAYGSDECNRRPGWDSAEPAD